ncbi:MAG: ABC transporter substrate-binding protein [Solirubrobacterales bacterium]
MAISALLAALLLAACGGSSSGEDKGGGTLRVAYNSFPEYLDPALSYSIEGWTATYDTYIPLLTYAHADGDAGARVIPGLAKSLPKISDGGRTYTLTLRRGLRYSDGTPVRASDFVHTLERVFRLNSPGSPFYASIVGAEEFAEKKRNDIPGVRTDDATGRITIHLVQPRGTFANELASPIVALVPPQTPVEDMTAKPPPGTGPYEITASRPGRSIEYARNPYWASNNAALLPQIPDGHVDRIEVDVIRNASTEVDDVERGRYDLMQNPPPADRIAGVREEYAGTQFEESTQLNTYYFWMNTTEPPFDDLAVRQAVNYAIDPRALERIYAGQLKATHQILPKGMPGYEEFDLYPHDMKKAKQMIAAADPAERKVTVWAIETSPNKEAGEYYAGVLDELGFETTLKVVSADNYFVVVGNRSTRDRDTGWADWFIDYPHPNDYFQAQLSGASIAPTNNANFAEIDEPKLNREIDRLAREQLGPKQEAEYSQLDREFMELAPWAPYGALTLSTFVAADVDLEAMTISPIFGQDFATVQFK